MSGKNYTHTPIPTSNFFDAVANFFIVPSVVTDVLVARYLELYASFLCACDRGCFSYVFRRWWCHREKCAYRRKKKLIPYARRIEIYYIYYLVVCAERVFNTVHAWQTV